MWIKTLLSSEKPTICPVALCPSWLAKPARGERRLYLSAGLFLIKIGSGRGDQNCDAGEAAGGGEKSQQIAAGLWQPSRVFKANSYSEVVFHHLPLCMDGLPASLEVSNSGPSQGWLYLASKI